jgi:hypothetical protein
MKKRSKWITGAAVILGLAIGGAVVTSPEFQSVPEGEYIKQVEDRDFQDGQTVKVEVKDVKDTGDIFGWCVYGEKGGLWMSQKDPKVDAGSTIYVKPIDGRYILGSWVFRYDMVAK